MRKVLAILLSAVIMVMAVSYAGAETADLFDQLNGKTFDFASGVGGWSTELIVGENGSFTGNFHDSEMGETGDGYPDGTVYGCVFHGQFTEPVMTDEFAWTVKIRVEMDEGQAPEVIEDEIRYVTSAPYGVEKAQTVAVFLPGTPVERLPEGFVFWSHLQEIAPDANAIPYYAIWSEADEAGFISGVVSEFSGTSGSEETESSSSPNIKGAIEGGAYGLNVKQNRPGERRADEMAQDDSDGETVSFERAPGLPAYDYSGNDPIEGAVANFLAGNNRAKQYLTEPGYVTIPCPIIHKTETVDDSHVKVYGSFWILNYVKRNNILVNLSGGEYPGIMTLERNNDKWQVTAMEEAGDGDDYVTDIMRFAAGDKKLEKQFFAGADLGSETNQSIRTRFVKEYVETNSLNITAYQDYGWDPVPLK